MSELIFWTRANPQGNLLRRWFDLTRERIPQVVDRSTLSAIFTTLKKDPVVLMQLILKAFLKMSEETFIVGGNEAEQGRDIAAKTSFVGALEAFTAAAFVVAVESDLFQQSVAFVTPDDRRVWVIAAVEHALLVIPIERVLALVPEAEHEALVRLVMTNPGEFLSQHYLRDSKIPPPPAGPSRA